jgi:hypothetical protein
VVTGQQVSQLNGTAPNRLVAFATSGTGWAQIPVQVDERKTTSMASIYSGGYRTIITGPDTSPVFHGHQLGPRRRGPGHVVARLHLGQRQQHLPGRHLGHHVPAPDRPQHLADGRELRLSRVL